MNQSSTLSGLKPPKVLRLFVLLFLFTGWGNMLSVAQTSNCQITKTNCPPADLPVYTCPDKTEGGVLGANVSWSAPQFGLSCQGTGNLPYAYVQSFDRPASQQSCWEYNRTSRVGQNGGLVRLWQGSGTNPPTLTTPGFFLQGATNALLNIASVEPFTVNVVLIPNAGPEINAGSISIPNTSGSFSDYPFTITPPATGSYRIKFVFNGGSNNSNAISLVAVNAPRVTTGSCEDDANFFLTSSHNPGDFFPLGNTTVTYTATYITGSTTTTETCVFDVVVYNEPPTIVCPANATVSTDPDACTYTHNGTGWDAVATDNCPGVSATFVLSGATTGSGSSLAGQVFNKGVTTVTWTATNASGKSVTCSYTVTVNDNQNPSITCTDNKTVNTNPGVCTYTHSGTAWNASGSDNCPGVVFTYVLSGATTGNGSSLAGQVFNKGETTVTWTATDASNNIVTCSFTVTVNDMQNPTITAPANVVVGNSPNMCSATNVALGTPVFADNCPGATVSNNAPATFPLGVTTVVWTVTDASGNTATASQTVTVEDRQMPVITTCPPARSDKVTANNCSVLVPDITGEVVATDNCTAADALVITQMPAAGAAVVPGVHTIVVSVKDMAGNTTTCNVVFTVIDDIAPEITTDCGALAESAFANSNCLAPVPNFTTSVQATDNCSVSSPLVITQMPAAGTLVGLGVTTVTITVTDGGGNTATCTTTFTVSDNTPPTITCPTNITVEDDGCGLANVSVGMPMASDNCSEVTVAGVRSDGKALTDPYLLGTTTITWTATDGAGLTSTCNQSITVVKGPGTLLVNYSFVGLNGFPFNANETATGITSQVTSSQPFISQNSGTSTGPLAFKQNIGTNPLLNMQPSSGENTRYHEFVVSGPNLKFYNQFKIYFQAGRQPQGATRVNVAYSTDGTNYTFNGSVDIPSQNQWYEAIIDYSGIDELNGNDLENLYIRLYASGATVDRSTAATRLEIDNFQMVAIGKGIAIACNEDVEATVAAAANCEAMVELTAPIAESLCGEVAVIGSRSDGMELSDPYPIGTTTVTWTATDPGENRATCTQLVVVKGLIDAVDDVFTASESAGIVGNVLANDILDCGPANTGNVTIVQVTSPSHPGITLNPATGEVNIDVNTPIGTYTFTYRICETGSIPERCNDGTVTINVTGVLPVTGLRLMANRAGNDVNLNWITLSEQNTSHFILERSLDGTSFGPIPVGNRVNASGNSNSQRNYSQVDKNITAPVVYYRVRLYDNDGSFRLSNVVAVRMTQGREFRVFPNPVVTMFTIEFPENGIYRVDLISANGQLIQLHREVMVTNSSPSITLPRNNLISGMYELRVTNTTTGKVNTVKLIYQPR